VTARLVALVVSACGSPHDASAWIEHGKIIGVIVLFVLELVAFSQLASHLFSSPASALVLTPLMSLALVFLPRFVLDVSRGGAMHVAAPSSNPSHRFFTDRRPQALRITAFFVTTRCRSCTISRRPVCRASRSGWSRASSGSTRATRSRS
jgi:hypothetical protein